MIRLLAQIISRQIGLPREAIRENPAPPHILVPWPVAVQTPAISQSGLSVKESKPGPQILAADGWPQPSTQALVGLFTELAQRHLQKARAQGGNP